jgi:hypothetical protein
LSRTSLKVYPHLLKVYPQRDRFGSLCLGDHGVNNTLGALIRVTRRWRPRDALGAALVGGQHLLHWLVFFVEIWANWATTRHYPSILALGDRICTAEAPSLPEGVRILVVQDCNVRNASDLDSDDGPRPLFRVVVPGEREVRDTLHSVSDFMRLETVMSREFVSSAGTDVQ